MNTTHRALVPALALTMLCLGACAAPPVALIGAGVGVVDSTAGSFRRGELRVAAEYPYDDVKAAVRTALLELGFSIERENETAPGRWFLLATDETNADMAIRVVRRTPVITVVRFRMGLFGDRPMSALVAQHVGAALTGRDPFDDDPFDSTPEQ